VLKRQQPNVEDDFLKDVQAKPIEEVKEWIQQYMVK
jgi:hypothetical protein